MTMMVDGQVISCTNSRAETVQRIPESARSLREWAFMNRRRCVWWRPGCAAREGSGRDGPNAARGRAGLVAEGVHQWPPCRLDQCHGGWRQLLFPCTGDRLGDERHVGSLSLGGDPLILFDLLELAHAFCGALFHCLG